MPAPSWSTASTNRTRSCGKACECRNDPGPIISIADIPRALGAWFVEFLLGRAGPCAPAHRRIRSEVGARALLEIDRLGEPIGKQDQYAASYGGMNPSVRANGGVMKTVAAVRGDLVWSSKSHAVFTGSQRITALLCVKSLPSRTTTR